MFTFILVSSLFLLWGVCNGMIDVMDKHFQEELHLNKAQSAWVQFAHYLGYFLMSMPAGWLAIKLGYKGGIIAGLLLVAVGGFWFIPATHINALVHEGAFAHHRVRGLPGRRLRHRHRPDVSSKPSPIPTPPCWATRAMPPRASTWRNPATASAGSSGPSSAACIFYSKDAAGPQHGQPDALHSLCGSGVRGDRAGRRLLLRQRSRYQDGRRLSPGRLPPPRHVAFHLVAPALRAGGGGAVFLRGGAGRHFQFLHQLHDVGSSRHSAPPGTRP